MAKRKTDLAAVWLWGKRIGAVSLAEGQPYARFEYDPEFVHSGIELSPFKMPLGATVYTFPELEFRSFHGLPGLLADSLPDKFGNAVIDAWLSSKGRNIDSLTAVERLCYQGKRGMGALEFVPAYGPRADVSQKIQVDELVRLANQILAVRKRVHGNFKTEDLKEKSLLGILRVGSSAGGARAKAVIAWNPATGEVRSGQLDSPEGFEYKIYGICFKDIKTSYGGYPVYIKEGACKAYSEDEHLEFEPVQMTLQLDKRRTDGSD